MTPNLLLAIDRLVRRLDAWPRRLVLRATGEPVELLELHDSAGRRRCLVELRGEYFGPEAAWFASVGALCAARLRRDRAVASNERGAEPHP